MPERFVPLKISQIKDEDKIALLGKVKETKEMSFILEDDTGEIEILSTTLPEKNSIVRVFCSREGNSYIAEILQDMSKLDLNILKEVEELYNKVGENV